MQALKETQPPSVSEVARRNGLRPAEMYRVDPELSRAVADRRRQERGRIALTSAEQLKQMVHSAVEDLHREGLYPSYDRVAEYLPKRGYLRHPVAIREWRDALSGIPETGSQIGQEFP